MRRFLSVSVLLCFQTACLSTVVLAVESGTESAGAPEPKTPAAEYGEMVRSSGWRSGQEQLQGFHLPPGFEIRLFASEPQIAKPLNLAVDDRGRVWMTQTTAYPKPAVAGDGSADAVVVLEDSDGDGQADRITTFADGLNIPIGVLPYGDGCICFSIPNIYYLRDTNGDGVCDHRELLFGPFDTSRDTHGMVNSLRDGGDGWIYACHGFNNRSVVAGTDGHQVRLESGNTFRFRPDGTRIEQYTHGQVNPFGMTRDEWGYWYSADCHSKPITQLIRGACYPSFGRPHDGLGFLPPTVDHLHGSTAISGILAIRSDSSLVPLRGQIISGNVMTSRLNRNRITYHGATARGTELSDFMTSDDTWFRPVDIQVDAADRIYVADFYNKIIGHYEVPLDHPDRDRTSGRVWQIRYVGTDGHPNPPPVRLASESQPTLLQQLEGGTPQEQVVALGKASDLKSWPEPLYELIVAKLDDTNPHVVRAAVEAIGLADTTDADTWKLIAKLSDVDSADIVLRQSIRIAIRNRLMRRDHRSDIWNQLITSDSPDAQRDEIAAILLAVDGERVVAPLVRYLADGGGASRRGELIRHAATHADEANLSAVVKLARELSAGSIDQQEQLLDALLTAQTRFQSGKGSDGPLRVWTLGLATESLEHFLKAIRNDAALIGWSTSDGKAWEPQQRNLQGGQAGLLRSSHTRGEPYVGILRSDPFPMPESIEFFLAGHTGPPGKADHGKNFVRLVRVSDGGVIDEVRPPRNDTAQRIIWTRKTQQAERVRIEAHDGDDGGAYAWLAVGHFSPPWLDQTASITHLQTAMRWASRSKLTEMVEPLEAILHMGTVSQSLRLDIAWTLAAISGNADWQAILASCQERPHLTTLADEVLNRFAVRHSLSSQDGEVGDRDKLLEDPANQSLRLIASHLSVKDENAFATQWVRTGASAKRLLDACETGWLNASVLAQSSVKDVLRARGDEATIKRLERLAASASDLAMPQDGRQQEWVRAIATLQADSAKGAEVFKRHCAACHQLRGNGVVVGPQLDGVLSRSDERLVEDILMPDRNVDAAFRTTSFLLDDGRVIVGLVQSEDGQQIRLADQTGKIIPIDPQTIETRIESNRSLMPSNFAETLSAADLANLFLYMRKP